MARPHRDLGDNFPFLKNFTGIAGVRGQQLRFQRAAGAGWAGEQVEGSILGAPHTGHPVGPQAGTPSRQGSCPLPWPPPPRGCPPAHQQEPSPSPDPSYPWHGPVWRSCTRVCTRPWVPWGKWCSVTCQGPRCRQVAVGLEDGDFGGQSPNKQMEEPDAGKRTWVNVQHRSCPAPASANRREKSFLP